MNPTEVEVRFDVAGALTVLSFVWQGVKQPVTSQGRQWAAADGQHVLVMASGERGFELVWTGRGPWHVLQAPGRELRA